MKDPITVQSLMAPDGGIYFGAKIVKPEQFEVKEIRVHNRPHWEEVVLIKGLQIYGETYFRRIGESKVSFAPVGCDQPDAYDLLEKEGVLLVGIGDTPFNEHETFTRGRVEGECAATLGAKLLRFDTDSGVVKILKYALRSDTTPMGEHEISSVLKLLYKRNPEDPMIGYNWAMTAIDALFLQQLDFTGETACEFENKLKCGDAGVVETTVFGGRKIKLIWVHSALTSMSAYCRAKQGLDAAVVVQENGPGRIYISTNKRHRIIAMPEAVRLLRIAEFHAQGHEQLPAPYDSLTDEALEGTPWYRDSEDKTNSIFAGGSARDEVEKPKTRLSLEEIVSLVRSGLIRTPIHVAREEKSGDEGRFRGRDEGRGERARRNTEGRTDSRRDRRQPERKQAARPRTEQSEFRSRTGAVALQEAGAVLDKAADETGAKAPTAPESAAPTPLSARELIAQAMKAVLGTDPSQGS